MSRADNIEKMAAPIVHKHGCDLVLLTFRKEPEGFVLRLLIEKTGSDPATGSGVDHTLCAAISRELDDLLEAGNLLDQGYRLEVSSPGIERPLVRLEDYVRFTGRKVKLKTGRSLDGRKRFEGNISTFEKGVLTLVSESGDETIIPFEAITKANLVYDPAGAGRTSGEK